MDEIIDRIIIKRNNTIEGLILKEIKAIADENGIDTTIILNEKAIVEALKKQIPKKPTYKHQIGVSVEGKIYKGKCCECGHEQKQKWWITQTFCDNCGQALDWSDT